MAATSTSHFESEGDIKIGRVFTPPEWAEWCLESCGVYDAWRNRATILEPTCGDGAFFLGLANIANRRGDIIHADLVRNLFGVEIVSTDKRNFLSAFSGVAGIDFPSDNFIVADFLGYENSRKFDIAIGNPPWSNFTALPPFYKEAIKPLFEKYGLVKNRKEVLLGASRVDIAALVIQKCMTSHVKTGGKGYFFAPLSLFFNESANAHFRPSPKTHHSFSTDKIVDFRGNFVFPNIGTRNGLACLSNGKRQMLPIPYEELGKDRATKQIWCFPSDNQGAWRVSADKELLDYENKIRVANWQKPRRGINTGGLNKVFILETAYRENCPLKDVETFKNGFGKEVEISTKHLFPLAHGGLFGGQLPKKQKYILCLYDSTGNPLRWGDIESQYGIMDYLRKYREMMKNRKGVLIQSRMKNGVYWALLGVGDYTFRKWKVMWQSMGKNEFNAVVVEGSWQGNQAMHSYISSDSRMDAMRIRNELNDALPAYLKAFNMEGTCNWAQPGRIKGLLSIKSEKDKRLALLSS